MEKTNTPLKVACIIPARLHSSRFPKKILANLGNKPLLQWIWDAATKTDCFNEVLFAVDAPETAAVIESFGGKSLMTSIHHPTGTHRLIEVCKSQTIDADIWVNWQGDEPFVTKQMIDTLLSTSHQQDADVWTLKKEITKSDELTSPHCVKVVTNVDNCAMYFSRSPIPFYRAEREDGKREKIRYYKHIGLYAYSTKALQKIAALSPCECEEAEKIEALRFLYHGLSIKVHETTTEVIGIDTPLDLQKAEAHIKTLQ